MKMSVNEKDKNWIIVPIGNCIQYIGEEIIQTTVLQRSIINLSGMQAFLNLAKGTFVKNKKALEGIEFLIKEQRFLEEKSKELISSNYNSINSHSLVNLWASIETAIEDTIVYVFMYAPDALCDLESNGYNIKKFLSGEFTEESSRKLYRSYEGQVRKSERSIGSAYSRMMEVLGLKVDLSDSEKSMLAEINAIRNCIMHRGGILDKKAAHDIVSNRHCVGQKIKVSNELYLEYYEVISKFASTLLRASTESKYIVVNTNC